MDLASYLKREISYTPWAAALDNVAYIDKVFSRTGAYGALKVNSKKMLQYVYDFKLNAKSYLVHISL